MNSAMNNLAKKNPANRVRAATQAVCETVLAYRALHSSPRPCGFSSSRPADAYRWRVASAVLLYLLVAFASPGVQAQTDPTVQFIPSDWALIPDINGDDVPDIAIGDSFRLLFVTSTGTYQATSPDIGVYNTFVQEQANVLTGTGAPIAAFKDEFRALISTGDVDARDNSATNRVTASDQDAPIYWLDGGKIEDNYAGFYFTWDSAVPTNQDGDTFDKNFVHVWTGSDVAGTKSFHNVTNESLVAGMANVTYSTYSRLFPGSSAQRFGGGAANVAATNLRHLYALSPILTVASADATLNALTLADSASTNIPLAETFVATTTAYSASVANSVTSITVTPTTEHSGTVDIAGTAADGNELVVTGTSVSGLTVGANIITLTVTAEDTVATTVYTIAVTRAAAPLSFDGTIIADQIWTVDDTTTTLALPTASGGGSTPTYRLDGDLPAGLSFNAAATPPTISGQPSAPTSATTLTYTATDSHPTAPASPITLTFSVTVNPVPTVTLVLTPALISESGAGNVSTVTATLDHTSGLATTVTVTAAPGTGGTDTVAGDYTLSSNITLTIAAGDTTSSGTVTVTAVDNANDDPPESKQVTLSATATNARGITDPAPVTLTISDAPIVTLLLTPASIDEGGTANTSTVTASLNRASAEDITLTITAAPGTDTLTGDYILAGTTLTITTGATDSSGTVTVTAVENALDAPDKSVLVSATIASSAAGIAIPEPVTLTITDDDDAPLVTPTADPCQHP